MNNMEIFRRALGISRNQLASCVGVDRTMIWRYEKDLSRPSDDTKIKIAKVLGKSVEEIFFSQGVVKHATNSNVQSTQGLKNSLHATGSLG